MKREDTIQQQIAEFEALRAEMLQHMQSEIQITSFSLIFSSGAIGLFTASNQPLAPETLLLPLPVLWFSIYSVIEHFRQVNTIGTYIHHFFENKNTGFMWEHRLAQFRSQTASAIWKPFRFHGFIWVLHTALTLIAIITAVNQSIITIGQVSIPVILIGVVSTIIILHTFMLIFQLETSQSKYSDVWQRIQVEERSEEATVEEDQPEDK